MILIFFLRTFMEYLSFVKLSCFLTYLSSFTVSSWEMKLKLNFHCIYTKVVFVFLKAISTSLKIFPVKVALSFSVNNRKFLTTLTNWFHFFVILTSLTIISSFSIYLIVGLALTLFEKRGLTFCYLKQSLHQYFSRG